MFLFPTGFILLYEILLFKEYSDTINQIGLTTTILTNILTIPMTFLWLATFKLSCEEIDKLFERIQWECVTSTGIYNADIEVVSIDKDRSDNNEKNIIKVVKETMEEFEKLAKAWSLMLFVSLTSESIIVTNAGFLISKYTILPDENTGQIKIVSLLLFMYLILGSFYVTYVVCTRAEYTHKKAKEVIAKIK